MPFISFQLQMSCKLYFFQLFGWQTFKRVGASRTINRIYKLVLTLSITIQLALFFIVASIGLWLDSLINGVVGRHAEQASLYKVLMIVVLVVSIFGYIFLKLFMLTQTPAFSSLVEYCKSHFLSNLICSSLLYRAGQLSAENLDCLCLFSLSCRLVTLQDGQLCSHQLLSVGHLSTFGDFL